MKVTRTVGAAGILLLAFCAGAITAVWRGWGAQSVTVEVVNQSEQPLTSFTVRYETCGVRGSVVGGELLSGQSRRVKYTVCGEGGYFIEAQFRDGSVLKGTEGYVESGYSSTETITTNRIDSSQHVYRY
jgi:hypothetical protein